MPTEKVVATRFGYYAWTAAFDETVNALGLPPARERYDLSHRDDLASSWEDSSGLT